MLLVHVPLAMANSLSSSLIPSLSGAIARKDRKAAIEKTALAIRFAMLIAIPSAVGLTVLSAPVNNLLFRGGNNAEAIRMMMIGASAVIFLSLSTVTNAILQGLNRMNVPVRNALISLALHVIALYIMLMIFNMGIYSMVFASILFALFMCILNAIAIRNTLGYRPGDGQDFPAAGDQCSIYGRGGIWRVPWGYAGDPQQCAGNAVGGACSGRGIWRASYQAALYRGR